MSTEKEYIVRLNDPEHKNTFVDQMISNTQLAHVPDRVVDCSNERNFNDTQAHFMLTDQEAAMLANDPRVLSMDLHHKYHSNLDLKHHASQTAGFDGTTTINSSMKNWALLRMINRTNPFSSNVAVNGKYTYNLTGRGVDIVLVDSGVAQNHPELAVNSNGSGGSRVVDYDWTSLGVSGIVPLSGGSGINGFLGDCDGHGSNCATIAAGNTCGWARDARIYSIRAIGGYNTDIVTGAPLSSFHDIYLVFDLIKAFHLAKTPDPITGYVRPTICTNSWGFYNTYSSMVSTTYRGVAHATSTYTSAYGQVYPRHNAEVSSIDSSIVACMAAGVIVVGAAGNFRHKSDISGGLDYNNTWTDGIYTYHYHRGGTPGGSIGTSGGKTYKVIGVGALNTSGVAQESKVYFSQCGPGVDVYAPGVMIMGAYGNHSYVTAAVGDPRSSGYYLNKISGTSQATPNVAGVLACLAGLRPWMDQNSARNWISANATTGLLYDNTVEPPVWTDTSSLQGSPNSLFYMPYNSDNSFNINTSFVGPISMTVA